VSGFASGFASGLGSDSLSVWGVVASGLECFSEWLWVHFYMVFRSGKEVLGQKAYRYRVPPFY